MPVRRGRQRGSRLRQTQARRAAVVRPMRLARRSPLERRDVVRQRTMSSSTWRRSSAVQAVRCRWSPGDRARARRRGIGRILPLPQSGQVQPERPRGADPGVTPWFHALGQKRVVRSGVAQVLFSIQAVTQTVLLSQRKCLFLSSLSCGEHGIRSTLGVEIGSSRWIPRFGSPRGEIKGVFGTLNSEVVCRGVQVRRKDEVCRRGARSGRCRSGRRTAVRGHGVHVAERAHSRRARVGTRPWSWSSAGGSPDALAKAGVALVVVKENIRVGGKHDIPTRSWPPRSSRCSPRWSAT